MHQRIILSAISKVPEGVKITDKDAYPVSLDDLLRLGGPTSKDSYSQLKKESVELMEKRVFVGEKGQEVEEGWVVPWVQGVHYDDDKKEVTVLFPQMILPFICKLRKQLTSMLK